MAGQTAGSNGDALFGKGDFAGAAQEFRKAIDANPEDGRSYYRLGAALYSLRKYDEAAHAFASAFKLDYAQPYAAASSARAYAAAGDTDQAVEWLQRAATTGFDQPAFVDQHPALAALKTNPAFVAARERIRINGKPCTTDAEYKQLDFLLGEWEVEAQGKMIGHSRYEKISDGCIVQENWMPYDRLTAKGWIHYNPATKKWDETWVGPDGGVINLEGDRTDGKLLFHGTSIAANGARTLARVTFTEAENGIMRELSERSADDGKTWTTAFDAAYRRLPEAAEQSISANDRREVLEHLKTSRRIFHEALQGVTPEQAKFKPSPEAWSIMECAEHLAQAEKLLFADALAGLDLPPTGAKSKTTKEELFQAWGTATVKVKAPGDFQPKGRWPDLAAIEKVFDARRERSIDFITETERDLHGRICCGDLNIWQQILAMSAHTLRHVKQMEAVKADPAYPRG